MRSTGFYLPQLVHHADHPETLQVVVPPNSLPSADHTLAFADTTSSTSCSRPSQAPLKHEVATTKTHINFTRLIKLAEVTQQILRHQSEVYRQGGPSVPFLRVPGNSGPLRGISLGPTNIQTMTYLDTMLMTGGVGSSPPPEILAAQASDGNTGGLVGVPETWCWQRSSEIQTIESKTSDIRLGLEAAGF